MLPRLSEGEARRAWPGWEIVLVFGLTVVALLSRVYALTELPDNFDAETGVAMLSSRTLVGLGAYLRWGLLGTASGAAHLLPQLALFHLFGTSVYTLRLAAVLSGVVAVPLTYWLARRVAGTAPAVVATVVLIAAPEQLFWSRTEDGYMAPVAVAALVTAHLGLWLTERVSVRAVLAAAVWMPFCRFFYAPAMVLCAYPVALYMHAMVCVRGAWRGAWYTLPLLAGGAALWFVSLSVADAALNHWQWRFVNPSGAYGEAAWTQQGQLQGASMAARLRLRAVSTAANLGRVATAMASHAGSSAVYARADDPRHPTLVNVGLLVLIVLGLGYLLGQVTERRAFALLLWVALGLVPALLSDDPANRRMAATFPALYVVVGVFAGAVVRLARLCAGRVVAWATTTLLSMTLLAVVWSSLASHFLLRMAPLPVEAAFRFAQPLFQESDVIFHNFDWTEALLMVFGNAEDFLARPPCYQAVAPTEWLSTAIHPRCDFTDTAYGLTLPPERIAALRAARPGTRISFLLKDQRTTHAQIELLRALYPDAQYRQLRGPNDGEGLVALTVDLADAAALRTPSLLVGAGQDDSAGLASDVLAGVRLARSAAPTGAGLRVAGGLLIERAGWYRFAIDPPCAQAGLTVDELDASALRPMLSGVHPFVLTLPDAAACALPVQLVMESQRFVPQTKPYDGRPAYWHREEPPVRPGRAPIPAEAIVSPAVAALAEARAPSLATYDGYGEARRFVEPAGHLVDFGIDAAGTVFVLLQEHDVYRVDRFSPEGSEQGSWDPQAAQGYVVGAMAVAPDGRVLLRSEHTVWVFDRDGHAVSTWNNPPMASMDVAILDDGRVLSRLPDINSIAILDPDGRLQASWGEFAGAPGRFRFPASVTGNRQGDLLIIESEGQGLLFHSPPGGFEPQLVRRFGIAFSGLPVQPQGVAFDGSARILVPDPDARSTLVYGLDGQRLMAAVPERDLNTRGFGNVQRYQATAERLYVLDEARHLWVMAASDRSSAENGDNRTE